LQDICVAFSYQASLKYFKNNSHFNFSVGESFS
jgi:hypothetical protein